VRVLLGAMATIPWLQFFLTWTLNFSTKFCQTSQRQLRLSGSSGPWRVFASSCVWCVWCIGAATEEPVRVRCLCFRSSATSANVEQHSACGRRKGSQWNQHRLCACREWRTRDEKWPPNPERTRSNCHQDRFTHTDYSRSYPAKNTSSGVACTNTPAYTRSPLQQKPQLNWFCRPRADGTVW